MGRWLGVSKRIGSQMAYYVLAQNGQIMSQTSVQRITNLESREDTNKQAFTEFDVNIKQRLCDDNFPVKGDKPSPEHWAELIEYDQEFLDEFDHVISSKVRPCC